jgi:hypothetical protein
VSQRAESTQEELARRHAAASRVVLGVLAFTVLLAALALTGVFSAPQSYNPHLVFALRLGVGLFGVGAVVFRRTRFSAMRLRDIAGLRGPSGLLNTLQKTTVEVAFIGGAVALMGFAISVATGLGTEMLFAGAVAVAVLLYAYPSRAAWRRVLEATAGEGDAPRGAAKGSTA